MKKIYTYEPKDWKTVPYAEDRCIYLAKKYSELTNMPYGGTVHPDNSDLPAAGSIIIPFESITPGEAIAASITQDENIYGAVVGRIKATKSICHLPMPGVTSPQGYDEQFSLKLAELGIKPAGNVCFSVDETMQAIDTLRNAGKPCRLKMPLGSSHIYQKPVGKDDSKAGIAEWLTSKATIEDIAACGIVVEEEITPPSDTTKPFALSSGQLRVGGEVYSYIGWQTKASNGIYNGTIFTIVRGDKHPTDIPGLPKDLPVISDEVTKACRNLLVIKAGRINLNYLFGHTNTDTTDKVYFTEPTFRPGGASPAELMGIAYLNINPKATSVWARSFIEYATDNASEHTINPNTELIWRGHDKKYGITALKAVTAATLEEILK